ncbi:MAG: HAMP domain-containing histidine kinase [Polyangiaceae bacterium]|nr:HAMP domain-containing histidine kinase [Polyangiaceae bacterium]
MLHFEAYEQQGFGRTACMGPIGIGLVFSIYVLLRIHTPPKGLAFWAFSVTADAAAAHVALASNVLWPSTPYFPIFRIPEAAGILISTMAAGLRLSLPIAVWGGFLNTLGILSLLVLDRAISGPAATPSVATVVILLILVVTAGILAAIIAAGTRRIVIRATGAALRAEQAERGLGSVLADCHDARSVLTSARLSAELVGRIATMAAPEQATRLKLASERLLQDLGQVERLITEVNSRAITHLSTVDPPSAVLVGPVAERVARQVQDRFPAVRLRAQMIPEGLHVAVSGGPVALHRILLNLLCNACEGDGIRGASVVSLEAQTDDGFVELRVIDDGPGIAKEPPHGSTKADGIGVGLRVVKGIVEASGGRTFAQALANGGTTVVVRLPRAIDGEQGPANAATGG